MKKILIAILFFAAFNSQAQWITNGESGSSVRTKLNTIPDSLLSKQNNKDTSNQVRAHHFDATGDILIGTGNNTYQRLAKGNSRDVLKIWSGIVGWHPDSTAAGGGGIPVDSLAFIKGTSNVYLRDTTDKVGIGTTAPLNKLDVRGGANIYTNQDSINLWTSKAAPDLDGDSGITILPSGSVNINTPSEDALKVSCIGGGSNATPLYSRIILGSGGGVYKLGRIMGKSISSDELYGQLIFDIATNITTGTFITGMKLDHNGYIYSLNTYNATVSATNRDLYIDNTGLIGYVSSDSSCKARIKSMENINWLYKLRPVNFIYKTDVGKSKQYGLIAEEVDSVNKDIVSYDVVPGVESGTTTTKPATVNYTRLITPLLRAIQILKAEIDTLNDLTISTLTITPDTTGIKKKMLAKTMYISLTAPVVIPTGKNQIANGQDSQEITLIGMHNTNNITLHDGDNIQLTTATITLKKFQTLTLIYAKPLKTWVEKSRSLN